MEKSIKSSVFDALTAEFAFTHGKSSYPTIAGKEFVLQDDKITKNVFGFVSAGTFQTVTVQGLKGFADYITGFGESDFVVCGTSDECSAGPKPISTAKRPVAGGVTRTKANFLWRNEPIKLFFDFDRPNDALCPPINETLAKLTKICPELAKVGFLVRPSASSGVYKVGEHEPTARTGGERWDFVFARGIDVERFVAHFMKRAWLAGFGHVRINKGGARHLVIMLDEQTEIDLSVFSPERIDFCGLNPVREGLARRQWKPEFIEGGWLYSWTELSAKDEAQAELLQLEALEASREESQAIARQRRIELGLTAARLSGCKSLDKAAQNTLKRNESIKDQSVTGHPIVYTTLGQTLDFVDFGKVDALDVLRQPGMFDGCICDDPLDPSKVFKGIFYCEKRQVFSFSNHGYLMRLKKIEVIFNPDQPKDTMQEIDAVLSSGERPDLFLRGGEIVQVSESNQVRPVGRENLPIEVGRLIAFKVWKQPKKGDWELIPHAPSLSFWLAYMNDIQRRLPELKSVRAAPVLTDQRLVTKAGFDRLTGFYLTKSFNLDEREIMNATRETAQKAISTFLDPFRHFPFVTETDKIVFVAACLAGLQRPTLGNVPLFAIAAKAAGTGKTLLAEAIALIVTGRRVEPLSFRADDAEMSKTWLSVFRESSPIVLFDNINARIGGDDLCSILTSASYRGRVLGASKILNLPTNDTLLIATANNPAYQADMTRRTLEIRLDAKCERPQERKFDENILEVCTARRDELLAALMIILQAWKNAGSPGVDSATMGSFEIFGKEIAQPLKWLTGVDCTLATPDETTDDDTLMLKELLQIWYRELGMRPVSLNQALENLALRSWAQEYFADQRASVNKRVLGKFLAKQAGRIVDAKKIVMAGFDHGSRRWMIAI